jgi:hypothetical protein
VSSYTFGRRVVVDGLVGPAHRPSRGIGPGSAFAAHELALVMYRAVLAVRSLTGITINIHVDDVSLNSTAKTSLEAQTALLRAGACVVDLIETSGGLTFSADKAQLISNNDELARSTAALMGIRSGSVEQSVRKLG